MTENTATDNAMKDSISEDTAAGVYNAIQDEIEKGKEKARNVGGLKGGLFKLAEWLDEAGMGGIFCMILNFLGVQGDTLAECMASMSGNPIPKEADIEVVSAQVGKTVSQALTDPSVTFETRAELEAELTKRIAEDLKKTQGDAPSLNKQIDKIAAQAANKIVTEQMGGLFDKDGNCVADVKGLSPVKALAAAEFAKGLNGIAGKDKEQLEQIAGAPMTRENVSAIARAVAPTLVELQVNGDSFKAGRAEDFKAVYTKIQDALKNNKDKLGTTNFSDAGLDALAQKATVKFFEKSGVQTVPPEFEKIMAETQKGAALDVATRTVAEKLKDLTPEQKEQLPMLFGREDLNDSQLKVIAGILAPEFIALNDAKESLQNDSQNAFSRVSAQITRALNDPENVKKLKDNGMEVDAAKAEVFANTVAEGYVKNELKTELSDAAKQDIATDRTNVISSIATDRVRAELQGLTGEDREMLAIALGIKPDATGERKLGPQHVEALTAVLAPIATHIEENKSQYAKRDAKETYGTIAEALDKHLQAGILRSNRAPNGKGPLSGLNPLGAKALVDHMTHKLLDKAGVYPGQGAPADFIQKTEATKQQFITDALTSELKPLVLEQMKEATALKVYAASKGADLSTAMAIDYDDVKVVSKYYEYDPEREGYKLKKPLESLTPEQRAELKGAMDDLAKVAQKDTHYGVFKGNARMLTDSQMDAVSDIITHSVARTVKENGTADSKALGEKITQDLQTALNHPDAIDRINSAGPSTHSLDKLNANNKEAGAADLQTTIAESVGKSIATNRDGAYDRLKPAQDALHQSEGTRMKAMTSEVNAIVAQIRGGQNVDAQLVAAQSMPQGLPGGARLNSL